MRRSTRFALALLAAAALVLGTAAAKEMTRLPADKPLPSSEGSPGPVVFSHQSHVDSARPDCTRCHPGTFPILAAAKPRPAIRHEAMEKGELCGSCHNGRAGSAFGFDDCTTCHRSGT